MESFMNLYFLKSTTIDPIQVGNKLQEDFKFIYLDHDENNISEDWKFWRNKLEKGHKVPVFFNRTGNAGVKHFGLAYMYKLPFEYSTQELLPYRTYTDKFAHKDLAETVFGTTDEIAGILKGRVMTSHAFSENAVPYERPFKEILAEPKASFYPFYLDQEGNRNKYRTYMNNTTMLRGYKRYPAHKTIKEGIYNQEQLGNANIFSHFIPLKAGAEFTCKVRFHNLRKMEIGGLLSAITFHGSNDQFFHSIGGLKAFGYGKIAIKVDDKLKALKHSKNEYLSEFERHMNQHQQGWINSATLTELLAIAQNPSTDEVNQSLVSPRIKLPDVSRNEANEFVNYKNEALFLEKYSVINGSSKAISIIEKLRRVEEGFDFNTESLIKLKAQIKEQFDHQISKIFHTQLEEAITHIYNYDKLSQKQLSNKGYKTYIWETVIVEWLGEDRAKQLYSKLTGKST